MDNTTKDDLKDISFDFSLVDKFFNREGDVDIDLIMPGMNLKKIIKIKSKFDEGIVPIKISVSASGVTYENEYTIKVGGTRIY